MTEPTPPDSAPVNDGWVPEPDLSIGERLDTRFDAHPIEYFRSVPARFFACLGTLVFLGGWAVAVYVAWFADDDRGGLSNFPTTYKLQNMMSMGMQATIAAGILWGVAAFLWVRVLPAFAEGATEA